MFKQTVEVNLPGGLCSYSVPRLVQTAVSFDSQIHLQQGEQIANAKSLLGILAMGINRGTMVELWAEGSDEQEAVASLATLLEQHS